MNYKSSKFFEFLLTALFWGSTLAGFLEDNYPASVLEDARLTTMQLLRKYKYPAESHYVVTEDKYILQMHRIARPGAKPVFLMHGLEDTSATWILMGPHSGLAYYLYDDGGYDVWLGNARGNRYSRNHSTLNPDTDKSFWRFSWHEIGYYDLPAMIDAVLAKTSFEKLTYFGHSQGTTSFFVMASSRPQYNQKVHIMHALAPVAFMSHIKAPLQRFVKSALSLIRDRRVEFLPHSDIALKNCFMSQRTLDTCVYYLWEVVGKDPKQMNMTMLPVVMSHLPAGCSLKQVVHYIQLIDSARFCQYNYGARENTKRYGRSTPPEYAVTRITAPIGLYYTYNDYLASELDVKRLAKLLPNVAEDSLYPYRKWNHLSMVWGIDARRLAHKRILTLTRHYDGTEPMIINTTAATTTSTAGKETSPTIMTEEISTELTTERVVKDETDKKDVDGKDVFEDGNGDEDLDGDGGDDIDG